MNFKTTLAVCSLAFAAAACSDDGKSTIAEDAGAPTLEQPDANVPVTQPVGDDAGATQQPIPLQVWVDDLVDHHSADDAVPDTVDDKNIADDEDPSHFDARFQ